MKRILPILLAIVAAAVGAGCGSGETGGDTRKVTVVLDWTPNPNHAGLYLAKAGGDYAAAGLDVEIIEPDQAGALAQLAAGNADFALSYAEQVLPARSQGTGIVSIATILKTNTSSLLSPADRGIRRPRDLAGKRYGGYGGELESALVKSLVRCDGGDPDRVKFVEVGNADYKIGLDKKAYDFVWIFDGWDTIRLRDLEGMDTTTIAFRDHFDCIPDWYTPVLTTSDETIAKDPELVRAFLGATAEGYRTAIADPAAAADALIAAVPESNKELVTRSSRFLADQFAGDPGSWGRQDPAVWGAFAAFLQREKILTKPVDAQAAFTNDFLPASGT